MICDMWQCEMPTGAHRAPPPRRVASCVVVVRTNYSQPYTQRTPCGHGTAVNTSSRGAADPTGSG